MSVAAASEDSLFFGLGPAGCRGPGLVPCLAALTRAELMLVQAANDFKVPHTSPLSSQHHRIEPQLRPGTPAGRSVTAIEFHLCDRIVTDAAIAVTIGCRGYIANVRHSRPDFGLGVFGVWWWNLWQTGALQHCYGTSGRSVPLRELTVKRLQPLQCRRCPATSARS